MNIRVKTALISASIVLLLAAAVLVIFIGRSSEDYEDKLLQAGIYLESRDYDNAIAIYNRIISEDRSCAEAYAGLSEAYFAKSNTDKALEILEKGAANTDNDKIITDKRNELFPDIMYASSPDDEDSYDDEFSEDTEAPEETSAPESESESETESAVTTVPDETESETTVPTTAATTVPTTAATTVPTTAASVVITTAPPVVTTAPPVTTPVTTRVTTAATTVTTTVATTTEMLKDISVADLTLMTLDEAYAWCSKNNIILSVVGVEDNSSKIVSQSPAPNSTVKENSSIIVVLEE